MTTWNKFCFTGGYVGVSLSVSISNELTHLPSLYEASVTLPGANNILGLWPAVWAMGNLGRAAYGASLDGTWPYTYGAYFLARISLSSR